jgi:hypothetical protein
MQPTDEMANVEDQMDQGEPLISSTMTSVQVTETGPEAQTGKAHSPVLLLEPTELTKVS